MGFKNYGNPELPKFIQKKVNHFFENRVAKVWNNGDLIMGSIVPDTESILLNNNDYLRIANDSEISHAQQKAIARNGNGQMMSAVFRNHGDLQSVFENKMGDFLNREGVLLTQSGWKSNTGLLQCIADSDTVIYLDMLVHMSMWEGAKISGAKIVPFAHNNMAHLERKIKSNGPGIICVDSVYSTDGDLCPLEELAELSHKTGCCLIVDESHSLGTHGKHGEGLVAELGISEKVHFITASLSKAFSSRAGIIACNAAQKKYISYNSKPAIFSSMVAPYEVAGMIKTIEVIKNADKKRERLREVSERLCSSLRTMGFNILDLDAQIIGLRCGSDADAFFVRDFLNARGIFGSVFAAPATPKNRSILRLTVHSDLTDQDLTRIEDAMVELAEEAGDIIPNLMLKKMPELSTFDKVKNKLLSNKSIENLEVGA